MSLNFRSAQNFYKPEIVRVQNCFMCIVIPNLWFIIKVSPVISTRHKIKQSQVKIEVKITRFILWQVYN